MVAKRLKFGGGEDVKYPPRSNDYKIVLDDEFKYVSARKRY